MTVDVLAQPATASGSRLPLIWTLALRDLRGGLRGFYIFVACVALGVAVIAGVGALADALRAGFARQGELLLGGDVAVSRPHVRAEPEIRTWLDRRGQVSEVATLRAMARRVDASEQVLVEIKGVDAAYPLIGDVRLDGSPSLADALVGRAGAAVDPILLERLSLRLGDRISVGTITLPVTATIVVEPDRLTDRLSYGPRVLVSLDTLQKTGLVEPGSLVRWRYAVKLSGADRDRAVSDFGKEMKAAFPEAGFVVRDRRDPSPQVSRTLDRLRQFLTLIGLAALLVGGIGVANAVAAYIDRRRRVVAIFRSLGATSRDVFGVHLVEIMLMSLLGIAIGLAVGTLVPLAAVQALGGALPIKAEIAIDPRSLALAAIYGLLVSLLFTLWPLGRAEQVRAGALFRDEVASERRWPPRRVILATALCAAALVAMALLSSEAPRLAAYYCAGLAGAFVVFLGLGQLITLAARRVPRPRYPELALAIGNLGAPGGLTRSVVLSLGAGLTLLVAVTLVDHAIVAELTGRLPKESPNFFVLDIKKGEIDAFRNLVDRSVPGAAVSTAPMLRGRIVQLGGRPVEEVKPSAEAQWVLNGDRGLSYSEAVPEGSKVVAGSWWPADYQGPPLVSFEADLAKGLGLKLGDTVTVSVLGRNITARLANLREVRWESLAINFVMVFSPNTLEAAPYHLLATVTLPSGTPLAEEARLAQTMGREMPAVTAIRVKDAINAFGAIFERIMTAVRVAGSVTLLAGALVLAGAMATAQGRRIKQAVILKTLGATRRRILVAHAFEYTILAVITALLATMLGSLAAWLTLSRVMEVEFVLSGTAIVQALAVAIGLVLVLGGFGTWQALTSRPVPLLRTE